MIEPQGIRSRIGDAWSKDFIKHLRTVHFALAALSLTLVVVTPSLSRFDYGRASEQVAILQKINERSAVEAIQTLWDLNHTTSEDLLQPMTLQPTPSGARDYKEDQPCVPICLRMQYIRNIAIRVGTLKLGLAATGADVVTLPKDFFDGKDLSTYDGIRDFWTKLDQRNVEWVDILSVPDVKIDQNPEQATLVWSAFDAPKNATISLKRDTASASLRLHGSAKVGNSSVDVTFQPATAPFSFGRNDFIKASKQLSDNRQLFGTDSFESKFAVLARFVTSFRDKYSKQIESEKLETIAKDIEAEKEKESAPATIFGIPFPHDYLPSWGVILLISVQAYFWIHLCELTSRIQPDSQGWGVAWIGMYNQSSARHLFKVSACAIPAISILFVSAVELSPYSRLVGPLEGTILVLGIGATLTLGWLTYVKIEELQRRRSGGSAGSHTGASRASAP